jgi:hypothetical protein
MIKDKGVWLRRCFKISPVCLTQKPGPFSNPRSTTDGSPSVSLMTWDLLGDLLGSVAGELVKGCPGLHSSHWFSAGISSEIVEELILPFNDCRIRSYMDS